MYSKTIRFAASGLVLGATMVGCKPSAEQLYRPVAPSAKAARANQQAAEYYQEAQVALSKGKLPDALAAMENAVALSPRDAGFRMGLAELYMKSGRFRSAETTLEDVLVLNPTDGRAGIRLALTRLAQGRHASAVAQLHSLEGQVEASDLGLAYALAGETTRALELLEPAAREPDATGRVRQNLALAYAFAGDWKKARITASQDISPSQLNSRLEHWAALAAPSAVPTRVANILGVKPVEDAGQPSRLALAPAEPEPTAYAGVPDAPVSYNAPRAPETVAAPAPVPAAERPLRVAFAQAAPIAVASPEVASDFVPVESFSASEAFAPVASVPAPEPELAAELPATEAQVPAADPVYVEAAEALVKPAAAANDESEARMESIRAYVAARYDAPQLEPKARKTGPGRYVVQLGAFSTPSNVETAWARAIKRYGNILDNEPLSTTIKVGGDRTLYRLSMAGFDSRRDAASKCRSIRAKGGACFVRTIAGDAPVRWASRYTRHG